MTRPFGGWSGPRDSVSMLSAQVVADQAMMTARDWMRDARVFVEDLFPDYSDEAKAVLMASVVTAAGTDEVAMHLRGLVTVTEDVEAAVVALAESVGSFWSESESD